LLESDGEKIKLACSAARTADGELLALRLMPPMTEVRPLASLALAPETLEALRRALQARAGLVLAAGPAQSGRTTALYSMLHHVEDDTLNVVSLERDAELPIRGVRRLLPPSGGAGGPARQLRAALQQNPDVLLLDELADAESTTLACEYAAGGRLVLAGIAAPHALAAVSRLMDVGVPPPSLAAGIGAVLALRLCARVCPACAVPCPAPTPECAGEWRTARGCDACGYRGAAGRVAVHEVLVPDDDLRYLIARRVLPSLMARCLRKRGFRSLRDDALAKGAAGLIAPDELERLGLEPHPAPILPAVHPRLSSREAALTLT
jgi:general secretion pathway protein E